MAEKRPPQALGFSHGDRNTLFKTEFELFMEPAASCPLCGQAGPFSPFIRAAQATCIDFAPRYSFACCPRCQFVFQDPVLTDDSIDEYYREVYRWQTCGGVFPTDECMTSEAVRAVINIRFLDRWKVRPLRVLDVGSSSGAFLAALKNHYGCKVAGVEPNTNYAVQSARAGFPTYTRSEEVIGSFDLITCVHTLEHIKRPLKILRTMWDLCQEGGKLFVEVPILYDPFNWRFAHVCLFTPRTLDAALRMTGWKPVRRKLHSLPQFRLGFNNFAVLAEKDSSGNPIDWPGGKDRWIPWKVHLGARYRWLVSRYPRLFQPFLTWRSGSPVGLMEVERVLSQL